MASDVLEGLGPLTTRQKSATRGDLIFSRHFCQAAGDLLNSSSLPPTIVLYSIFPIFSLLKKKMQKQIESKSGEKIKRSKEMRGRRGGNMIKSPWYYISDTTWLSQGDSSSLETSGPGPGWERAFPRACCKVGRAMVSSSSMQVEFCAQSASQLGGGLD